MNTNTKNTAATKTITEWFGRNLNESPWLGQHLVGMSTDKLEFIASELTELDADTVCEGYFSEYGPQLASAMINQYNRNVPISTYAIKFAALINELAQPVLSFQPDFSFFKLRELADILYVLNNYTRTKRIAQAKLC